MSRNRRSHWRQCRRRAAIRVHLLFAALPFTATVAQGEETPSVEAGAPVWERVDENGVGDAELRRLDLSAPDYRTPRAGEGFRTRIFGRDVAVLPSDRRSTS